jgi:diphosphomevalonate decarboxylase
MTDQDFIPPSYSSQFSDSGSFSWASPSNIALVKYWGKRVLQIPKNPSISFTLSECRTTTVLKFSKKKDTDDFSFDLLFDGKPKEVFRPKIETFFRRVEPYLPFLRQYHFTISTSNSFPHSSGIASSASGMSALALCLMSMERALNPGMSAAFFNRKASFLARLGSGSACRSIVGELVVWGRHKDIEGSSDLYGIKYPHVVHESFNDFRDTILLVDQGAKQVSSSVGHDLMFDHPFATRRFEQAGNNIAAMKDILETGDLQGFIDLVESEALTLHAMMMTSRPYFVLMKPNTIEIINRIWKFREATKLHLCFTLDAGANVHVLYPGSEALQVLEFIENELAVFCENEQFINDMTGSGAIELQGP